MHILQSSCIISLQVGERCSSNIISKTWGRPDWSAEADVLNWMFEYGLADMLDGDTREKGMAGKLLGDRKGGWERISTCVKK